MFKELVDNASTQQSSKYTSKFKVNRLAILKMLREQRDLIDKHIKELEA